MARQRFEDTVKNLIKRKPKTDSKTIETKKAKVKEDIPKQFGLFMKCKCTLGEMNDYHPNKGIAVRVRGDALYYKWTFKHFSIAIQLYAETVNITFLDRSNIFERYFEEGIHISKYGYQKRNNKFANKNLWDIEQAKQSPFSVGLEFKQPVLYINAKSEGGEDWAIKTITPHLQNILSTFEELDRGIEEYNKKQATKVAKSTVKKITENLKLKETYVSPLPKFTFEAIKTYLKNSEEYGNYNFHYHAADRENPYDFCKNIDFKYFSLNVQVNAHRGLSHEVSFHICDPHHRDLQGIIKKHAKELRKLSYEHRGWKFIQNQSKNSIDMKNRIITGDAGNFRINIPFKDIEYLHDITDIVAFISNMANIIDKYISGLSNKKPTLAEVAKEKVKAIKDKKFTNQDVYKYLSKEYDGVPYFFCDTKTHNCYQSYENFGVQIIIYEDYLRVSTSTALKFKHKEIEDIPDFNFKNWKWDINNSPSRISMQDRKICSDGLYFSANIPFKEINKLEDIKEILSVFENASNVIQNHLNTKKQDIISIDMNKESAIEKEWKALTHEQWVEKSEAARLKLIAAISKDRQVPFVQVKNEESKVITCIQINALDKLLVKDLEDVLTRIEDATQVLNKEKAHKETLIKSIHTKYEEYSKLYKEIKGE